MTPRVVVLGGGVAGLATAVALARGGLPVDVLERDVAAAPLGRRAAGSWVRDGTPQAQHAHVFGPGCHHLLRTGLPDVLSLLLDAGAREVVVAGSAPGDAPGLALRRPLLDWVLRRTAEREPGVRVHSGAAATGVRPDRDGDGPVEVAVLGGLLAADLVVDATGSGSTLTGRLAGHPPPGPDTTYYSRCYTLRWAGEPGGLNLGLAAGGDFEGYGCRAVPGDNHTVTVTFAVPGAVPGGGPDAAARLTVLRMPDGFQAAAERVPDVADWAEPGAADPLGGVAVLTARPAEHTVADRPGLVALGDAGARPGRPVEHGVAAALAQALACAATVLAAGDELPPDLPARIRAAHPEVPPARAHRSPGGPDADELARIAEAAAATPVNA